ncbi:MAG: DnaJ domain-containing protein [Elainellaceae cyanobacterium]
MDLAECYRLLELSKGATAIDVKASYRRLARRFHPDVSSADVQLAKDQFIQLTEAYRALMAALESGAADTDAVDPLADSGAAKAGPASPESPAAQAPGVRVTTRKTSAPPVPLSEADRKLKHHVYTQLQQYLKEQRFPRAVTLIEGLARRLPNDSEVTQWQAIAYQRWARALIVAGQTIKARSYLKKALRTDPHNRTLWLEVERDFRRIESLRL